MDRFIQCFGKRDIIKKNEDGLQKTYGFNVNLKVCDKTI